MEKKNKNHKTIYKKKACTHTAVYNICKKITSHKELIESNVIYKDDSLLSATSRLRLRNMYANFNCKLHNAILFETAG